MKKLILILLLLPICSLYPMEREQAQARPLCNGLTRNDLKTVGEYVGMGVLVGGYTTYILTSAYGDPYSLLGIGTIGSGSLISGAYCACRGFLASNSGTLIMGTSVAKSLKLSPSTKPFFDCYTPENLLKITKTIPRHPYTGAQTLLFLTNLRLNRAEMYLNTAKNEPKYEQHCSAALSDIASAQTHLLTYKRRIESAQEFKNEGGTPLKDQDLDTYLCDSFFSNISFGFKDRALVSTLQNKHGLTKNEILGAFADELL